MRIEVDASAAGGPSVFLEGAIVGPAGGRVSGTQFAVGGPGAIGMIRDVDPATGGFRAGPFLPGEFTLEGGELTPTMKLKRRVVTEKYQAELEGLYA